MKNIFENAYFGKPYKTRDGRKAIYLGDNRTDSGEVYVAYEGSTSSHRVMKDGHYWATPNVVTDDDIISEWVIDEKKLHKLAMDASLKFPILNPKEGKGVAFYKGFKEGYRKSKQE